ncbi:RNA-directed DNA polymerase, eukaryota, reverse transcriptase zinc-binding domain protein [Tanacetum coccineum]|uniref:RNA-directed DNA polymerase, eukaryota, reverse transcriptase zinc-binding domain protein n=1 Tax=Tanacetum coccineum TaxID=301880 RepID=A0ABQ5EVY9_9ASTR
MKELQQLQERLKEIKEECTKNIQGIKRCVEKTNPRSTPWNIKAFQEDPRTLSEAMASRDVAFWKEAVQNLGKAEEISCIRIKRGNNDPTYLKGTMDYGLTYSGYPSVIEGYSDASWINNMEDHSYTSGWVFLLGGVGNEAEWLSNLVYEIPLWPKPMSTISIRCDSAATLAKAYSQVYNGKSRHLGEMQKSDKKQGKKDSKCKYLKNVTYAVTMKIHKYGMKITYLFEGSIPINRGLIQAIPTLLHPQPIREDTKASNLRRIPPGVQGRSHFTYFLYLIVQIRILSSENQNADSQRDQDEVKKFSYAKIVNNGSLDNKLNLIPTKVNDDDTEVSSKGISAVASSDLGTSLEYNGNETQGNDRQNEIEEIEEDDVLECSGMASSMNEDEVIGLDSNVCSTLETHLKSKKLSKACEKAFRNWDWISNVHLCSKGCRIIIGWDKDLVIVRCIHMSEQTMLCIIEDIHSHIVNFVSFVYAANGRVSFISNEMQEFNDCVNMTEVEDLCSSGLFFTWTKNLKKARKGDETVFDHSQAIIIIPNGEKRKKKAFKFVNFIADKESFIPTNGNLFDKVEEVRDELKNIQKQIDKDPHKKVLRSAEVKILKEYMTIMEDEEKLLPICGEFQKLSWSKLYEVKEIDEPFSLFKNRISNDEALSLVKDISYKEIKDALFDIGGRGLRQGDPMSPYLFTLVMECFTLMMERNVQRNPKFQFYFECKNMKITHVCFADDLLVLCHGDVDSIKVVKDSIDEFGRCSSLLPNLQKSIIFFGNVKEEAQEEIMKILPFEKGKLPMKYLGVPLITKRLGIKDYKYLVDKVRKRISKWKNKCLFFAGKAKIAWKKIYTLWVKWISTVKLNEKNFWEISAKTTDSWGWKNLLEIRDESSKHVWHKLGDGMKTLMWYDNWCEIGPLFRIISNRSIYSTRLTSDVIVAEMIKNGDWKWPSDWKNIYPIIKQVKVPKLESEKVDWIVWRNKDGKDCKFSIKEVYKDMRVQSSKSTWAKLVWYSQCIPKQSFILWMAIQGKLMTCDRMEKWGSYDMTVCALCKSDAESHDYLFFNCPFSQAIWMELKTLMQFQSNAIGWEGIINELAEKPNKSSIWSIVRRLCLAGAVYSIWRERNNRIFRDEECSWEGTLKMICDTVRLRLLGLNVKKSMAAQQVAVKWNGNVAKWDCFPEQLLSISDASNGRVFVGNIMDEVDIKDLTIEQYLRLTQESKTPKKIEYMTIAEYLEYEKKVNKNHISDTKSYLPAYLKNTPTHDPIREFAHYFGPNQPGAESDCDSKDIEEEVEYMTDDEIVMSEQEESNHRYTQKNQHFEEEDDVDEWLNAEITKHMSMQGVKNMKDALISIIKSIRQEMKDGIMKRQVETSTASDEVSSIASNEVERTYDNTPPYAKDNIMPQRVYEHLKLDKLRDTSTLENTTGTNEPLGTINILVKFGELEFPCNSVIEMAKEVIILGRPFLESTRAQIDCIKKIYMVDIGQEEETFNPLKIGIDIFSYESPACLEFEQRTRSYGTPNPHDKIAKPISFSPDRRDIDDTTQKRRYYEWVAQNYEFSKHRTLTSTNLNNPILHKGIRNHGDDEPKRPIRPRPWNYSFKEWIKIKIGHNNLHESDREFIFNEWILDSYNVEEEYAREIGDPYSRRFDEYNRMFNNEIEHLSNEYILRIGKKGYVLDDDEALPLGHMNGARFKAMNRKELEGSSLEALTRLNSSTWATKWFKRLVAYAKCNRDSYESELGDKELARRQK